MSFRALFFLIAWVLPLTVADVHKILIGDIEVLIDPSEDNGLFPMCVLQHTTTNLYYASYSSFLAHASSSSSSMPSFRLLLLPHVDLMDPASSGPSSRDQKESIKKSPSRKKVDSSKNSTSKKLKEAPAPKARAHTTDGELSDIPEDPVDNSQSMSKSKSKHSVIKNKTTSGPRSPLSVLQMKSKIKHMRSVAGNRVEKRYGWTKSQCKQHETALNAVVSNYNNGGWSLKRSSDPPPPPLGLPPPPPLGFPPITTHAPGQMPLNEACANMDQQILSGPVTFAAPGAAQAPGHVFPTQVSAHMDQHILNGPVTIAAPGAAQHQPSTLHTSEHFVPAQNQHGGLGHTGFEQQLQMSHGSAQHNANQPRPSAGTSRRRRGCQFTTGGNPR